MPRSESTVGVLLRRLVAALLLGGLGRVFVLHAPALADGVPLRFDEAVVLFAVLTLGAPWGAVTSLVATVGTPEPAYSAVWALEPLLAGWVIRRGVAPVVAVAGFWLLVAAVFVTGALPLLDTSVDARLLLAKQLVNGTLCAALAQVAATPAAIRRLFGARPQDAQPVSLRTQITRALIPVSAIPVILLGLGLGRLYATHLVSEGTVDLQARAGVAAARLRDYVNSTDGDVVTLAGSLSGTTRPAEEVQRILRLHHAGSVFSAMIVSDADGRVIAVSAREGIVPADAIPPVNQREYFIEAKRTGRPYRSGGFHGRGFQAAADAIVAVSAPYTDASGAFAGIVQGTVGLVQLSAWLGRVAGTDDISCLVLDQNGNVVASSGAVAPPLLVSGRDLAWVQATRDTTTATFEDASTGRAGVRPERTVAARAGLDNLPWQIHVRRSVASILAPLVPFYVLSAGWLLFCLGVATLIASRVSWHITQPLAALARSAESIGRGHEAPLPAVATTAPAEVRSLHHELGAMLTRLQDSLHLLDEKVRERSAELAAATARNDTMFRAASDGMLVLDVDRRIVEANDAFSRLIGVPHERLIGTSIRHYEVGATADLYRQRDTQLSRTGSLRFETLLRAESGDAVPVDVVATELPPRDGRLLAGVRDISERRRSEVERTQLEARLRHSQKMEAIGTLAGGIAHDFNNILTLIAGSADLAAFDIPEGHPARPYLEQIQRASARAEALVRQILTFSRRRDEQRDVVALPPIVREASSILRSTLPAMIEIRTRIDDDVPAVQADSVQLHQVLMNLGTNGAYAMREAGGVLTIALRGERRGDGGAVAVLEVSDTGVGMDRDTLERVFEPFFTTKPVGIGTGLGLAVVHGIVTSHGGTIDATSEPGRGTTFRVTLPSAGRAAIAQAPAFAAAPLPAHRTAHVLVVDDEPELVGLLCKQLTRLGYSARGCSGPEEALVALRGDGPQVDVVVSDLAMPRMSGIDLAEVIHHERPELPIVLCSGRVTEEDRGRAERAGVQGFLAKPFASHQLADVMARSLGATGTRH